MNGFAFKAAVTCVLSTALIPSLVFATSINNGPNKAKMFSTKLGCMACHVGESMQPDSRLEKKPKTSVQLKSDTNQKK